MFLRMAPAKPFDFLYAYATDRFVLKCWGIYPFTPDKWLKNYILRFLTCLLLSIYLSSSVAYVVKNFHNALKVMQAFYLVLTAFDLIVKFVILIIYCDVFSSLEIYFSNPSLYDTSEEMLRYMKKKVEETMKLLTVYRVWVAITLVAFIGTPFLASAGTYRLLSPALFPWKIHDTKSHIFTLFIQAYSSVIGASMDVTIDCTFAIFSSIVKMELHLLKENLKSIDFSSTNKQIKYELKKNMLLYGKILKITFAIQKIFNYVLLATFINSIILICVTGFLTTHTVIDEQTDLSEKINYVYTLGYFGYLLFQVSVYCYYGHEIMTESSDINEAIYLSNWYVSDKFIQKDLIILRERLKRPIIFKAGSIFPLTFSTLMQIFKWSYSVFTLLQQMD